jgi:CheY-like chemotaxis protein
LVKPALEGATLLWVDDHLQNNAFEQRFLAALGIQIQSVTSTKEALEAVSTSSYDVIVSDMARDTPDAGLDLLRQLRRAKCSSEVVFYVGHVDQSRPVPRGAFGIADRPEPLMHFVFDVLERSRV